MKRTAYAILTLLAINFGILNPGKSSGQEGRNQAPGLRIGFSAGIFADVNITDARASAKVLSESVMHKRGMPGAADAIIYETTADMVSAISHKQVDMVTMLAKDYLELNGDLQLEPCFVTARRGRITESSLLVVHRLSGINTLTDLKGKNILLANDARASMARIWLAGLLKQSGFALMDTFFGKVSETSKYSHAVLPVFFRQADACLVPRSGFETMAELNPQLSRDLHSILESPEYLSSVLCIRPDYSAKQALIESLANLHTDASGQQLLTMFHVDKLVPYQESYLASAIKTLQGAPKTARISGQIVQ